MSEPVPLPKFVQIEPVGQCNLRCRMCPVQFRPDGPPGPSAFMPFETFCRLVDQFGALTELHLQGLGEPMLHPQFFEMVAYASARSIHVSTNSNLTVMTPEHANRCVASGLRELYISIDGASAASYEAIRVRARLRSVLRNVGRLVAAKAMAASEQPQLALVAVAMRQNLDQLPALVRLAHSEGIPRMSVQHLCHDFGEASLPARYLPMRRFIDEQTLLSEDPQRIAAVFAEARTEAARLGIALRLPSLTMREHGPDVPGRERCDWPWHGSYISYDGKAMPCCMVSTPDRIQFGDMAASGVAPVWNNAAYQAFRERLSSAQPPDVCRSCALYRGTF
jgi:radical SAM protein with 4Fe4S-binding SPASM domain